MKTAVTHGLVEGIKIRMELQKETPKIFINSGIHRQTFELFNERGKPSIFDGYVPNDKWRLCDSAESSILLEQSLVNKVNYDRTVRISTLPQEVMNKYIYSTQEFASYTANVRKILIQKHVRKIHDYLISNFSLYEAPTFLVLRILKNLQTPTLTYDEKINQYIGLHIDCWDGGNISNQSYRNRICVNLGNAQRSFYFINLDLEQIKGLCKIDTFSKINKSELTFDFLSTMSQYPVIKIVLEPGEYYVAPTERIIHDATFVGAEDVTLTIIGYFK
jgi:hypothetical protein